MDLIIGKLNCLKLNCLVILRCSSGRKLASVRAVVESALQCFVKNSCAAESLRLGAESSPPARTSGASLLVNNLEREIGEHDFQPGQV